MVCWISRGSHTGSWPCGSIRNTASGSPGSPAGSPREADRPTRSASTSTAPSSAPLSEDFGVDHARRIAVTIVGFVFGRYVLALPMLAALPRDEAGRLLLTMIR